MAAGGYQILTDREYKPEEIHAVWDILFVSFGAREEAENFVLWLKKANRQAEESFKIMTD